MSVMKIFIHSRNSTLCKTFILLTFNFFKVCELSTLIEFVSQNDKGKIYLGCETDLEPSLRNFFLKKVGKKKSVLKVLVTLGGFEL